MNVYELIQERYGIKTTYSINPLVTQVGATVTRILPLNPRRASFTLINLGTLDSYFAPDNQVSSSRGIFLVPGGGQMSLNWRDDGELTTLHWFGIASGGSSAIFVLESLLQYSPPKKE